MSLDSWMQRAPDDTVLLRLRRIGQQQPLGCKAGQGLYVKKGSK